MNWNEWKIKHKDDLAHIAGFEEKFVDNVLSKINLIAPEDVVPQYHFLDSKGGNRYIDFMILNESKGYCLPIELDGLAKMITDNREYQKFNDFLERQNALIAKFGVVLRYSNKKMLNESYSVIKEITDTLNRQAQHQSLSAVKAQQTAAQIQEYENIIEQLKQKAMQNANRPSTQAADTGNQQMMEMIKQVQQQLAALRVAPSAAPAQPLPPIQPPAPVPPPPPELWINHIGVKLSAAALVVIVLGLLFKNITDQSQLPVIAEAPPFQVIDQAPSPVGMSPVSPNNTDPFDGMPVQVESTPEPADISIAPEAVPIPEPVERQPVEVTEPSGDSISVYDASSQIGQDATVCGTASQFTDTAKASYLNFGGRFPNHEFSTVFWKSDISVGDLSNVVGNEVCITGRVESYRDKPQIVISTLSQIR